MMQYSENHYVNKFNTPILHHGEEANITSYMYPIDETVMFNSLHMYTILYSFTHAGTITVCDLKILKITSYM